MTPEDLPLDWHDEWEERAAIMQYCGGHTRQDAEALAMADIQQRMGQRGDDAGQDPGELGAGADQDP